MNYIFAICGGSGSGKSSLANNLLLKNSDEMILISLDSYYKAYDEYSLEARKKLNYDIPDAFDFTLLYNDLQKLKRNQTIEAPIYSFEKYTRFGYTKVTPKPIIIFEGMYSLIDDRIRELIDSSVYLTCTEDTRLKRMIERDIKERNRTFEWIVHQFYNDVQPMHEKYVEIQSSYANCILNGEDSIVSLTEKVDEMIMR